MFSLQNEIKIAHIFYVQVCVCAVRNFNSSGSSTAATSTDVVVIFLVVMLLLLLLFFAILVLAFDARFHSEILLERAMCLVYKAI